MAVGYNADGSKAPLYDLGWAGPSGQMYSTVNDLMKVLMCSHTCVYICDWICKYTTQLHKPKFTVYSIEYNG